jgi:hypothetical protein
LNAAINTGLTFRKKIFCGWLTILFIFTSLQIYGQNNSVSQVRGGSVSENIKIDGLLNEPFWMTVDSITDFTMIEPELNKPATFRTVVKIGADTKNLYFGIICYDKDPSKIVSFSKARDADLNNEDHIKLVLDTYKDGRNGYIFAVNPMAARYDALASIQGEEDNANWDGIWEAKSSKGSDFWVVEIKIPVSTLTFKKGLQTWGFNIERRVQRFMETDRWAGISRDYSVGQTFHAGTLTNLPLFNIGLGSKPKLSLLGKSQKNYGIKRDYGGDYSFDLTQKITPDITAQLTVNTDFAETEVDSRKSNLTRFELHYPEKRQFFLEGADIYNFGLGLGEDLMPFFSRRIGLNEGNEIPVIWGGKVNGKLGKTYFGALVNQTGEITGVSDKATLGVVRIKQNILKESSVGMISTFGDPSGRSDSWTSGVDFTFKTSSFGKNKNFLIGLWGLMNGRDSLSGDKSAFGLKIDYPNDLWNVYGTFKRIGDGFDPSLGFVPRNDINNYGLGVNFMPRPKVKGVRQLYFETEFSYITDLKNRWESYSLFTAPINVHLESGDRFEFNVKPAGEYLGVADTFEISKGHVILPGQYNWIAYRAEIETASKRALSAEATYWFGGFYGGNMDQIILAVRWRPISLVTLEVNYEKSIGRMPMPTGNFDWDIISGRLQLNISSDLNVSSFVQYDTESKSLGSYSRLRWTFTPHGDLFLVYKHNVRNDLSDRWNFDSNQLIIKISYSFDL